jgi:hypothetical protein
VTVAVFLLLVATTLGAEPRPLPAGSPPQLITAATRVHVFADEALDSDYLRLLARPGVVLWLSTRTNTLKASTLDTLALFHESWVELRAPIDAAALAQLQRLPRTGIMLGPSSVKEARRLGPRRVAVRWNQALDEASAQLLVKARPAWVFWTPPSEVDALAWGLFKGVPGRKLFEPPPGSPRVACPKSEVPNEPALLEHATTLMSGQGASFPCGSGPWVDLSPAAESWVVQSVLVSSPSAELRIVIGADPKASVSLRKLLDELGFRRAGQ